MENVELDQWLAENVMGWHTGRIYPHPSNLLWWMNDKEQTQETVNDWHPTVDIEQAMMCAEKLDEEWMDYEINCNRHDKSFRIWSPSKNKWFREIWETLDELPHAICLALYEAKGGKK